MSDNKIYLHDLNGNLDGWSELNMTPKFFLDDLYLAGGGFYDWFKEDLSDSQIEKKIIHDIKEWDLYITTSKDPRIRPLSSRMIKIIFDWKWVIKKMRKYYEETE
jgi:hypothetical protein